MKQFLISPPFGNYFSHPEATRIRGSFTLNRRRGLIWNTLKSLRPTKDGWVNRIGLRNKGLVNLKRPLDHEDIWSIVGMEADDWEKMYDILVWHRQHLLTLEVNLGCPNVHEYGIPQNVLAKFAEHFWVIAKLPATNKVDEVAKMAVDAGVHYLHCSNTLPTSRGGESGRRLKYYNLPVVERIASAYPWIPVIAGGGIYEPQDIIDYEKAGAKHFSLSTAWFKPWRASGIINDYLD